MRLKFISLNIVFFMGVCYSDLLFSNTLYVNNGTSNTNLNSQASKINTYKTIQQAVNVLMPGDTLIVEDGNYSGFIVSRSGSSSKPIIIKASSNKVVIENGYKNNRDNILLYEVNFITITGFTVKNARRAGISIIESNNIIIHNNMVGPNGKWGIFSGFASNLIVTNNSTFGSEKQHGIYISNSYDLDDSPIIKFNRVYNNGDSGIQLNGDCLMSGDGWIDDALIEGNIVFNNDYKGLSIISTRNSYIQNNIIYDNGIKGGAAAIHLANEPGCDNPSQFNIVVNNTIIEDKIAAIRFSNNADNNLVFNNFISAKKKIRGKYLNNLIDRESNYIIGYDKNILTYLKSGNYSNEISKQLIDRGVPSFHKIVSPKADYNAIARPINKKYDIGAFEIKVGN